MPLKKFRKRFAKFSNNIQHVMGALFTKICSILHKPMAHCLQHLYYTSKAKLLSFCNLNLSCDFWHVIAEHLWQMIMMSLNTHKGVADP